MINVNLLPVESRKLNFPAYIKDFFAYIVVLFCVVIMFNVLLVSYGTKKAFKVQSVQREWSGREPQSMEIVALKKEVAQLRNKSTAFKQNVFPVVSFSQTMFVIHDSLPMNLWLRSFDLRDDRLILDGSALDFEGDASLSIKEYVQTIKESLLKDLFDGDIKIAKLERSRVGDKSVVQFSIELNKKAVDEK